MSLKVDGYEEEKVVVGIDFGMTCSAAAWAVTTQSINFIFDWPGQPTRESAGVPTEISYLPVPPDAIAWGFRGAGITPRYRWFKASLETQRRESSTPEAYLINGRDIHGAHKAPGSVDALIADYLRCLRQYVEKYIVEREPRLASVPVEYILAEPLGWSDASRSRALECAQLAGMELHLPRLVFEPQAAATYLFSRGKVTGKEGNTYVLCDAGGRTVDLVSFIYTGRIEPVLNLIGQGSCGNCGSTTLNMLFREFLVDTLHDSPGWGEEALEGAMEYFEWVAKRQFYGNDDDLFKVPVPGMANNKLLNIEGWHLHLYGAELRAIIGPVVEEVVSLVKQQIKRTGPEVAGMILVGGFGDSPFLYNSIKKRISKCIPVLRPSDAAMAVAAGAVVMAQDREWVEDSMKA